MTCSGQTQCWKKSEACTSAPTSKSCPVEHFTSIYLHTVSLASSAVQSSAGQNSGYDHQECLQYQTHCLGGGAGKHNKNPALLVISTPSLNRNNTSPLSLSCREAFTLPGIVL